MITTTQMAKYDGFSHMALDKLESYEPDHDREHMTLEDKVDYIYDFIRDLDNKVGPYLRGEREIPIPPQIRAMLGI